VRQLEGREVEIRGELKAYDGRAEIILENAAQLGGQAARISPLPKSFDVEQLGTSAQEHSGHRTVAVHARKEDVPRCLPIFRGMWKPNKHTRPRPNNDRGTQRKCTLTLCISVPYSVSSVVAAFDLKPVPYVILRVGRRCRATQRRRSTKSQTLSAERCR
jgi:hypothetical protein